MRPPIKYLSVCSGIEAATVAWHHMGWKPVGFSEIESFPSAVLKHHYPDTPNLGDMTKYKEWDIEHPDLLVGGTPCQSFSVAGLRKGMEDPRGNLALVYCGILDHFRPRWFVWENVPGVLSSAGGRDFGSFLGALAQLGYGFAYRVLDAQWFGVAQRRRRVFVVGYLGDWRPAAAVLFERESLRRDTAPSREKRQATTGTVTTRFGPSDDGGLGTDEAINGALQPIVGALTAKGPEAMGAPEVDGQHYIPIAQPIAFHATQDPISGNISPALGSNMYAGVAQPISIHPHCIGRSPEAGPQGKEYLLDGSAYCMDSRGQPQAVVQPMCFQQNTRDEVRYINGDGQIAGALAAEAGMKQQNYIAQPIAIQDVRPIEKAQNGRGWNDDGTSYTVDTRATQGVAQPVAPTLTASNDPSRSPQSSEVTKQVEAVLAASMAVRRLTPVECERLQGFPDNYTAIPWRGKEETPDGPRYKALGNSMAVPVMKWIGENIREVDNA